MTISFFLLVLIFILGASTGSFLSVVIHRIHTNQKGIFFGHSMCPKCRLQLNFFDMVPIISYAVLKGKCRKCSATISPHYLFLEIGTGLLFLSTFLKYPFLQISPDGTGMFMGNLITPFLLETLTGVLFMGILFYDLKTKTIPDLFLFPLIVLAAAGAILTGQNLLSHMIIAPLIALIFFGGQIAVSRGKWLGEGDLYLALAIALMTGWEKFLLCIVSSYILGAITVLPLLLSKKANMKSAIPFGPFLIIGALISLFFGDTIIAWYLGTMSL